MDGPAEPEYPNSGEDRLEDKIIAAARKLPNQI